MADDLGGSRQKRGGRVKGSLNKATIQRQIHGERGLVAALRDGITPLEVMLSRMRDPSSVTVEQFLAAVHAAPYVHPKLSTTAFADNTPRGFEIDLSQCSVEELAVLRKVATRSLQSYEGGTDAATERLLHGA